MGQLYLPVLLYSLGMFVLYWVIRLAVGHAIRDADKRRSQGES
ncbi:hypothetical protein AB0C02_04570 [Micromonospora sp. NPDC048999]